MVFRVPIYMMGVDRGNVTDVIKNMKKHEKYTIFVKNTKIDMVWRNVNVPSICVQYVIFHISGTWVNRYIHITVHVCAHMRTRVHTCTWQSWKHRFSMILVILTKITKITIFLDTNMDTYLYSGIDGILTHRNVVNGYCQWPCFFIKITKNTKITHFWQKWRICHILYTHVSTCIKTHTDLTPSVQTVVFCSQVDRVVHSVHVCAQLCTFVYTCVHIVFFDILEPWFLIF